MIVRCLGCVFWHTNNYEVRDKKFLKGECWLNPPKVLGKRDTGCDGIGDTTFVTVWPQVDAMSGCGMGVKAEKGE